MENQEIKGLGDVVEIVTVALGVKKLMPDCNDCKKRRERWNEKVRFKRHGKEEEK